MDKNNKKKELTAEDFRVQQLESMNKEDMNFGQFWEYSRLHMSNLDGYIIQQKIERIIADEFVRLQARVDIAYEGQTAVYARLQDQDSKVDILRAQVGRIGKYDGILEA